MRSFRNIPIRQKLVIIIMATTAAALLLAGSGIVLTDTLLFRGYLQRDLSALARIIADNSTAALAFNDPKTAAETLGALRARPHVVGACIYRLDGTILARYSRQGASGCPAADGRDEIRFTSQGVIVAQAILLSGRRIGTLMLLYDLGEITERITLYGSTVFAVLLASSLLAFLLSSKLRAVIATPISQLVRATTSVAETGDYSTRAEKLSGDELGVLVDRFNEMLAGIQSRDEDLKRERERFRFMAESMPQKIFTAAPRGDMDYFNRQWLEYTGLSFEQIKDWGWTQFVHPDDLDENVQTWRQSIDSGEPFSFEHRFRRADGKYRWHLSRAHAMRDVNGDISMWIGSSTDIHEQKEKEEALRRANDDLQQFAYSASHDLQEPIRNVAVYSELVAQRYHSVLDADGQLFLGFLKEGGRRLATLVNDLLAYTRAGMAEINETAVDSSAVLMHSLSSLAEAIRESNAKVTYDALPEVYMGEAHLQQILQNLISNALKYRDQDPPQIHISAVTRGGVWRFSVQDNGIGIDPKYKEIIFGVFKRLHHDRTYGGTASDWLFASGWLSAMAEESGSNRNLGKEQPSSSPSPDAPNPSVSPRWTLLLAEDNLPDALLVREAIRAENLPLDVHVAPDGQQAIEFIARAESDPHAPCPHFLLLDLNLPKVDGFEVLRRLRASEKCNAVPVLIVSSSDSPGDRSRAAEYGAGYFRKPPNYAEFLKLGGVLKQLLKDNGAL